MIYIPPLLVDQGRPYTSTVTWTRSGVAVDTSTWTGTITVKTKIGRVLVGTWAVDLTTPGDIDISLTAAQTALFPAESKLGRFVTAVFEIDLVEPGGAGEIFQGNVAVAGAV